MSEPTIAGVCPKCQTPYTQHAYEPFACACGWSADEAAVSEVSVPVKAAQPQPDAKGDGDTTNEDKP